MEIIGEIKVFGDTQEFGAKGFKKRELVLVTDEQYPQSILIEFTQDNTGLLDGFSLGDKVKVEVNLRGREWINPQGEAKYFNSLNGWKIESIHSNTLEPLINDIKAPVYEDFLDGNGTDLPF